MVNGLGVIIVLIIVPIWIPYVFSMRETPTGELVYREQIFEFEEKYYIRFNKEPSIEISRSEYLAEERKGYKFFVSMWLFVSYLTLVLWQYIWRWKRYAIEDANLSL